jgi:exopolysaccharide biosynthesis polyprenyl glycosylphosphotransferase
MPGTGQRGREDLALATSVSPADAAVQTGRPLTDEPLSPAPPGAEPTQAEPGRLTARARRVLSGSGWTATAVTADAVMLVLAVVAALIGANAAHVHASESWLAWTFPPIVVALLAIRGLYRPKITMQYLDEVGHVVGACSVAAMIIIALVAFFSGSATGQGELVARVWAFGMVYVAGSRYVLGLTQRRARQERLVAQRTLIIGAGRIGAQVERRLEERPELGLQPIGYIDACPPSDEQVPGRRSPVLGGPDDLESIVQRTGAEHVVLAFLSSRGSDAHMVPIVRRCDELGLQVSLVPRLFESINVRAEIEHIGGMPLFRLRAVRPKGWQFTVKHALDRLAAAMLILMLGPLLLISIVAVKLSSRGPVFFRQRRVGRDGRPFDLLKFRSMRLPGDFRSESESLVLPEDTAPGGVEGSDRRTAVGRLMRRLSIDELPQLFNVLRGDMSMVGPRPERPEFVELFERRVSRYDDRHRVKSGITGWAQVHGLRGKTSLSDRIEWDNYYIENWSLKLDLKILLLTISAVLRPVE